jgi:hypothetical protein
VSDSESIDLTHHAMLVVWGEYAHSLGLIQEIEGVPLHQKTVTHRPQTKILEFFVAILAGLEHLKDLSRSAHPIDQDQAVAKAWLQSAWADYSGVSRTLTTLSQEEAEHVTGALRKITQPVLENEVMTALQRTGRLTYDGDLTGRPVSNSSTTYPHAGYGHMDDAIQFGYQAAMVSLHSPTYGRLWLSVVAHPGNTAACTQAEAMILAAEAQTGLRPLRRTDLLRGRLQGIRREREAREGPTQGSGGGLAPAQAQETETQEDRRGAPNRPTVPPPPPPQAQETETRQQIAQQRLLVCELEAKYGETQRTERPYGALGRARHKLEVLERRHVRRAKQVSTLEAQLARHQRRLVIAAAQESLLQRRLEQFEADNQANRCPIQADFRLDAGFGTRENVALLIEMGYEVYTKPYADWLTPRFKRRVLGRCDWTRVGSNAEMVAWKAETLHDFPYPLDVALERFWVGGRHKHAILIHFGADPVTTDLPGWFARYNARQTIEAGIKEGKGVFEMHHLKVRTAPGLYLQEQFAVFAANFVRWAAHWLAIQCPQLPSGWQESAHPKVKEQVKVGAHTSALVQWQEQGCLLRFTNASLFAGHSLKLERHWAVQLPLPFAETAHFGQLEQFGL